MARIQQALAESAGCCGRDDAKPVILQLDAEEFARAKKR